MKRLTFILAILTSISIFAQDGEYSKLMIESQGQAWSQYKTWDYVSGLVTKSILKYTEQYTDQSFSDKAYKWCKAYADNSLKSDGSFINFKKGSLDNIASGKVLLSLYLSEEAKKPGSGDKYKKAADYLYNYIRYEYPRISEPEAAGCFIHKDRYPYQMWLDGLYMGAAFYAEYQALFGIDDMDAWSDIANQFMTIHNYTFDETKRLNYHAWSAKPSDPSSFWANKSGTYKGCSKEFWGRGMGWYFAALSDVLELMPAEHPDYHWLVEIYQEVAEGLVPRQDSASGVWYQLLQYDSDFVSRKGNHNYLEASASCMFTYSYLKGIRLGILDSSTYLPVALKAYDGLINTFITENANGTININQICRSAGLGPATDPSRDGTANYYLDGNDVNIVSNEGKGIGSFIMASLEYELYKSNGITSITVEEAPDNLYNLQGIPVDNNRLIPGIYINPRTSTKTLIR